MKFLAMPNFARKCQILTINAKFSYSFFYNVAIQKGIFLTQEEFLLPENRKLHCKLLLFSRKQDSLDFLRQANNFSALD